MSLPADPGWVRVVRLAAAGALSLYDFSADFVDDIRAALAEGCALVIGDGDHGGLVEVVLSIDGLQVRVEICGRFDAAPARTTVADRLSERLLEPLVDVHRVDLDRNLVAFVKAAPA